MVTGYRGRILLTLCTTSASFISTLHTGGIEAYLRPYFPAMGAGLVLLTLVVIARDAS